MASSEHNLRLILRLARAGNPVRAWRLFGEQGLGEATDDPKVLTLKGRLLKDLARLDEGGERHTRFREASQAYLAAHAIDGDSYPLINAAMLALMAGDIDSSHQLAQQVLDLLDSDPEQGENAYWREATRAEALLLLEHHEEAEASLATGIAALPKAWEDHAATIGQFESILATQDADAGWLDGFRPPSAVHFSGIIGLDATDETFAAKLDGMLDDLQPGFGFGALAAGADILIAEALLARGASLHVTLPGSLEQFREISVEPFGGDWAQRFDTLIAQAETVEILHAAIDNRNLPLAEAVRMGDLIAMGQCLRQASILKSRAVALTIAGRGEPDRAQLKAWESSGLPLYRIDTNRVGDPARSRQDTGEDEPRLCAMLAGAPLPDRDAARDLGVPPFGDGSGQLQGNVGAVLELARDLGRKDAGARLAMSVGLMKPGQADPVLGEQVSQILAAATAGSIATDRQSAMICKATRPDLRIEELGEIASLTGPISLWSISPQIAGQ